MDITNSNKPLQAARQIQRALKKNPNDIQALLQRAALLGTRTTADLAQKRKLLHHILSLEPANRTARAILLDMDRAEIGGDTSRLSLAVILTDSENLPQAPLLLRYSIVHQLLVYLFITCTALLSLPFLRDAESLALVGALLVFQIIPLWFVSAVIGIGDASLSVSRLFGIVRSEITWGNIKEIRPTLMGHGVKIITRKGKTVEVSSQINGYPFILDILQQKRPDLFDVREAPWHGAFLVNNCTAAPAAARISE